MDRKAKDRKTEGQKGKKPEGKGTKRHTDRKERGKERLKERDKETRTNKREGKENERKRDGTSTQEAEAQTYFQWTRLPSKVLFLRTCWAWLVARATCR